MAAARRDLIAVFATLVGCATAEPAAIPSELLISDYAGDAIVRFDGVTGETVGMFARLDRPAGMQLGPHGDLFSAGFGQGEVARYDLATGTRMEVVFWDTTLLEEPVEIAFRGDTLLALGNDTANTVVLAPGQQPASFGAPTMRAAHDFDLFGDRLYVATDTHPELGTAVQVWNLDTRTLERSFAPPAEVQQGTTIVIDGDGIAYVGDWLLGRITRYDALTGESLGVLVDGLERVIDVELAPDGTLAVLDAIGVECYDRQSGARLSILVDRSTAPLSWPRAMTFVVSAAIE
ncbi:MAG TPA: hypothetical protein VFQ53_27000 [Kofleriaceae bacterium]|nr:hypothetical protein [Kofleriaceae bacterium]